MSKMICCIRLALIWVVALTATTAQAETRFWVKIEGEATAGEADTKERDGWIEGLAWSWGGSQSGTTHFGSGGGAGKAAIQDLSFVKYTDRTTPALMRGLVTGQVFPTVWLDAEVGEHIVERYAMRNARVTSHSLGGSGGEDRFTENISFSFTKIERGYLLRDPSGRKPVFQGSTSYDLQKNKTETSGKLPVLEDKDRDGTDNIADVDQDNNGREDQLEGMPIPPTPSLAGITGFAWLDLDANGVRDAVEPPAIQTRAELYAAGNATPIQSHTVNEQTGSYAFLELPPGDYQVRFIPEVGFQFGPQQADSSPDPSTGFSMATTIAAGNNVSLNAAILSDGDAYSAFTFDGFDDPDETLILSGESAFIDDAASSTPILQLTPNFPQRRGSAFTDDTVVASSFSTHFQFRMRGFFLQGDGFAFVVNDYNGSDHEDPRLLGSGGSQLGYGGIPNSFAVEFDTLANGSPDPNGIHVGILENGVTDNDAAATMTTTSLGRINDGTLWNAWIDYDGTDLEVYVSASPSKPATPLVSKAINYTQHLTTRKARVGFTAATFSATQAHEILYWSYQGGQDNALRIDGTTSQAELDAVVKAPGNLEIENDTRPIIAMANLETVCGDLIIRNNGNLQTINLPNLIEVVGDVIIEGNHSLDQVELPKLRKVTGNVRIATQAAVTTDLANVQSENLAIVGVALQTVTGTTGFGETKVEIDDEAANMALTIPEGAFTVPEVFEVQQLDPAGLQEFEASAFGAGGTPLNLAPVLGFEYSFAGGGLTLNREVEVRFEIDLGELSLEQRDDLLTAFDSGMLTVFGSRGEDDPIEVFAVCNTLAFGVWENCAQGRALDASGNVVSSELASVLEFTVFARHFSTYGVTIIDEVEVLQSTLDAAAQKVWDSLTLAPTLPEDGFDALIDPIETRTLTWTSQGIATTVDALQLHPTYSVEFSTDLTTWTPIDDAIIPQAFQTDAEDARSITVPVEDSGRERTFFRVVMAAP